MESNPPSAAELARYLESRGDLSKPWMLQMLRLAKLKEARGSMSQEDYMCSIRQAHSDLMRLGELELSQKIVTWKIVRDLLLQLFFLNIIKAR